MGPLAPTQCPRFSLPASPAYASPFQLLAFLQGLFTFYHHGYELAKDFGDFKTQLTISIQNVSVLGAGKGKITWDLLPGSPPAWVGIQGTRVGVALMQRAAGAGVGR